MEGILKCYRRQNEAPTAAARRRDQVAGEDVERRDVGRGIMAHPHWHRISSPSAVRGVASAENI